MLTDEDDDFDFSQSSSGEDKRIVKAALPQLNECAEKFEEGLEMLMTLKKNNEELEKAKASSMAEFREKFDNHLLELNNWIVKLQFGKAKPDRLGESEKQTTEIKAMTENLIESFRTKVQIYRDAEEAERNRREQQRQWIGSSLDAMISQLSKTAFQAALLQVILCAQQFEAALDVLMGLKRNDARLETAIVGSMDGIRANFNKLVLELTNWIGKLQGAEAMLVELGDAVEKKAEIKATFEGLIGSFKRKVQAYKEAEEDEMKRRKQQMKWLDTSVDSLISTMSNAAQKVSETNEE